MEMGRSPHFIADTWKEESMSNEHLKSFCIKKRSFSLIYVHQEASRIDIFVG